MKLFALIASASAWSSSSYASSSFDDLDFDNSTMSCGGTITSSQLLLPPLDENGFYFNHMGCHWDIQFPDSVSTFHMVALKFAVEDCDSVCDCDAVIVNKGQADVSSHCGWAGLARRKRRETKEKETGLESKFAPANSNNIGFPARTFSGNTASISFITDQSVTMKGFQICIYADGDDIATVCPPPSEAPTAPEAPATNATESLSPAEAWGQIEAAATDLATVVDDFYGALPGLGANSVLASKKVARFNDFFAKMQKLNTFSSADACTYPAGSNDHSTFVSPVDSADGCEELNGLFVSLASFLDSYVCLPNADFRGIKLTRLIQRQRRLIMTRKLRQMNCGN